MKLAYAAAVVALAAGIAQADDFEESVAAALEAYRAGDLKAAKSEIDFAAEILGQLAAEGLSAFLPAPPDGWERRDEETETQSMAAFGGGQMASAAYSGGGETVEVQLMAGNQMVATMGAMFANTQMLGTMGKVKRIKRQRVVLTRNGEVQAMVGQVMVQITGSADDAVKEAFFEALDIDGLKTF